MASQFRVTQATNKVEKLIGQTWTEIQDSPFASNFAAIQAACNAVDPNGGDTISILAGTYDIFKTKTADPIVTSSYWELKARMGWAYYGQNADWSFQETAGDFIMVKYPCTIKGVKTGETFSTILDGQGHIVGEYVDGFGFKAYKCAGFIVHNNATVDFRDLKFKRSNCGINFFYPGTVKNCYFEEMSNAITSLLDDRIVFPQYEQTGFNTKHYLETLIENNTFYKCSNQGCYMSSGATLKGNTFTDYSADTMVLYVGCCVGNDMWTFGSKFIANTSPDDNQDGFGDYMLFEPQDARVPHVNLLCRISILDNEFTGTGGSMVTYIPDGYKISEDISIGRNKTTNSLNYALGDIQLLAWPGKIYEAYYAFVPAPYGTFQYIPCKSSRVQVFNNEFSGTCSPWNLINVFAGALGSIKLWSFSNNVFKGDCLAPIDAVSPYGIQFGPFESPDGAGGFTFGEIKRCSVSNNNFTASGAEPVMQGVALQNWGSPPTECTVYQPASTWPDPNLDIMSYMYDGDENAFVDKPIKPYHPPLGKVPKQQFGMGKKVKDSLVI